MDKPMPTYITNFQDDYVVTCDKDFQVFYKVLIEDLGITIDEEWLTGLPLDTPRVPLFNNLQLVSPQDADVAVLGIPFANHISSKNQNSQDFPDFLREMSSPYHNYLNINNLKSVGVYEYGIERYLYEDLSFVDIGNLIFSRGKFDTIEEHLNKLWNFCLDNETFLLSLGGDHSITYSLIKTLAEKVTQPIVLIQFDAHHDCGRHFSLDEEIDNSNFVRHLLENNIVDQVIQLGVRGIRAPSSTYRHPNLIQVPAARLSSSNIGQVLAEVCAPFTDYIGYLTFDLDFINPKDYADVNFAIPGGSSYEETINILYHILNSPIQFLGGDMVEGVVIHNSKQKNVPVNILAFFLDGIKCNRQSAKIET